MTRFVLTGLAAENSLRPLAAALRARGLPVTLVDLAERPAGPSVVPPGEGPLVLVTSQHLAMSGAVYDAYSGISSHYRAPRTIADELGADLLVYVPHDLAEPVIASELHALSTVDLYVAVDDDSWWAAAHVPTVVCGWVGTAFADDSRLADAPLERGVLFLTQVRWLLERGGSPFVLASMERTLDLGVAVKLPLWPGLDDLRAGLASAGVPLLDPELPASVVAGRTPLVATNGPSSVLAEAVHAGHRPLCVLPPEGDRVFAGQLGSLDVVLCRDEDVTAAAPRAGRVRAGAPAFDVEAFLAAADDALAGQ